MRNYFNAIVEFNDSINQQTEIIIKIGEVDPMDDIHVDIHVSHQSEIEDFKQNGHPEFKIIKYWKAPGPTVDQPHVPLLEPARTMVSQDIHDWLCGEGKYGDNHNLYDELNY